MAVRREARALDPCILKFDIFPLNLLQKMLFSWFRVGNMKFHHFCPPWKNPLLGLPGKNCDAHGPAEPDGPADTPVHFFVTGISPIDSKKAAKLKPTDFHVHFLLFLLLGTADTIIWRSFNWMIQ